MEAGPDKTWKKDVSFPINYDSGQSSDDNFDTSDVVMRRTRLVPRSSQHLLDDEGDGAAADLLGSTPPRARIRDKEKRRAIMDASGIQKSMKDVSRRNTVDNFYKTDAAAVNDTPERIKKRASLKLSSQRAKEREWKQDVSTDFRAESLPVGMANIPTLVESCNRFKCLSSRLKSGAVPFPAPRDQPSDALPQSRVTFHNTFTLLINMGNAEKGARRTISREEQVWQNELKDLIWLELQARIAGRSLAQQDAYLCAQRHSIPALVRHIHTYRFVPESPCARATYKDEAKDLNSESETDLAAEDVDEDVYHGCLSFECVPCANDIGRALREICTLLDAFFSASALYPSTKAMVAEHPDAATLDFNNRWKAMCLWCNNAFHMRVKMLAIRQLIRATKEKSQRRYQHLTSVESDSSRQSDSAKPCQVRFCVNGNPTDSSNSDSSSHSEAKEAALQKEITNSQKDVTSSQKDITSPQKDSISSQKDSISSQKDITSPLKDNTIPQKDSTSTQNDSTSPQKDVTSSRKDSISSQNDITGPQKDSISSQKDSTSTQKDSISTQKDEIQQEGQPDNGDHSDSNQEGVDANSEFLNEYGRALASCISPPGLSTPERPGPGSTVSSQESGYSSAHYSRQSSSGSDVFTLGELELLTSLTLMNSCQVSPYRHYLRDILKTQGVRRSMMFIQKVRKTILKKVFMTFEKPNRKYTSSEEFDEPAEMFGDVRDEDDAEDDVNANDAYELRRYGSWSAESLSMRLPSLRSHFMLLSTLSMEVVHDYLALRIEDRPDNPSCLTVKQLIHELKEGIDIATDIRANFVKNIEVALEGYPVSKTSREQLLLVIRTFDTTVETVVKQYLSYLVTMSNGKFLSRSYLQAEWTFASRLAKRIKCVAAHAPTAFTDLVCQQIQRLMAQFTEKFDEFKDREKSYPTDADARRNFVYTICREAQCIYAAHRELLLQTMQFARQLAARLAHAPPPYGASERERIFSGLMQLRSCFTSHTHSVVTRSSVLLTGGGALSEGLHARTRELVLHVYRTGFELHKELYRFAEIPRIVDGPGLQRPLSLQHTTGGVEMRRRPQTMLVHESVNPMLMHKELHRFAKDSDRMKKAGAFRRQSTSSGKIERPRLNRAESASEDIDDRLFEELNTACGQNQSSIERLLAGDQSTDGDDEVDFRSQPPAARPQEEKWAVQVSRAIIEFAQSWMRFVTRQCERGRGLRPRWASQGLEFLMLACDPYNTRHLSESEFDELKQLMDECISHVIGSRPPAPAAPPAPLAPLARAPDPAPRRHRLHSPLPNSTPNKDPMGPPTPPTPPTDPGVEPNFLGYDSATRCRRIQDSIRTLDRERDQKLRTLRFVGRVLESAVTSYEPKLRQVTFKWQRGLKIGAGTFGKVYTVINTETSQLLAMKELSIGVGDRRAMQRAANELRVLEGVIHPHLVRYYGCELHREEMLIFMELCVEGSLEALVATSGALPEQTTRRYSKQLVSAVAELHNRNIAHRDIKSGNIFLTNEGHCLKLGDFGCAVKIRANTTAIGELQGTVGTQAYMAPEVFMKSSGHGRAADVWSLGCVVAEMASGERPFAEYDSNYQIMFVVGMGGRPRVPDSLSPEGRAFALGCLTHETDARPRADELASHHFLMVKNDDDCNCEPGYLITK